MKKVLKYGVPLLIGIALGVLGACGVYELTVSQGTMDWQAYIEEQVIPILTMAGGTIGLVLVTAIPIVSRVKLAVASFNQATSDVNETANTGKTVAKSVDEYGTKFTELSSSFNTYRSTTEAELKAVRQENADLRKMLEIGFCNDPELVKNGYARQILEVGKKGTGTDEQI